MKKSNIYLEAAVNDDLETIQILLKRLNLVYKDIENLLSNFIVAKDGIKIVGCGSIEIFSEIALLRSLAVDPEYQGRGIGHLITNEILQESMKKGVEEIYLITDTASKFFDRFGFSIISRDKVDERIKQTYEYTEGCPKTAIIMKKNQKL